MLQALHTSLNLNDPFEACIWAMVTCTFWGMMCFGEVSVYSHSAFNTNKHLKQQDTFFRLDLDNKHYARLDLPSTKMAKPGEIQSVFMVLPGELSLLEALQNLSHIVPARLDDPLFLW